MLSGITVFAPPVKDSNGLPLRYCCVSMIYLCLAKHIKPPGAPDIPPLNLLSGHFPVVLCPASACAGSPVPTADILTGYVVPAVLCASEV